MNHSFDLNEHLMNAVQHSNDAIMTKTLDGTVLTWNPAAERMFGYAASEMVGQKLLKILPSDRVHEEDFVLSQVAALHEGKQPVPWKMADAPPDYLQDLLKNIVGIQIGITRLIGKNKLGQDEELKDMRGAGQALQLESFTDSHVIGSAMLELARQRK